MPTTEETKGATKDVSASQKTLRDKLAELVGVDPESAANDDAVVGALTQWMEDTQGAVEKRAKALQAEFSELEQIAHEKVDLDAAAAEVLEAAETIRQVRKETHRQHLTRRGSENIEEAADRSDEIVQKAIQAGEKRSISGITALAIEGQPADYRALMARATTDPAIRTLQRANDDLLLMATLQGYDPKNEQAKVRKFSDLPIYPTWSEAFGNFSKALSSSTSGASYWEPTFYSDDMIMTVREATQVYGLFPTFPWPGPGGTATVPREGTDITIYTAGEATTDDSDPQWTASTPGIGTSVTITARAFAARSVWSYEFEEDSIIPVLEHMRYKFAINIAEQLDRALLDGDADGTHQDTGLSLSANDARRLFNGLRKRGLSETATSRFVDASDVFNFETLCTPLLNMGAFLDKANTVCICSPQTALKLGVLRDTASARVGGNDSPIGLGATTFPGTGLRLNQSSQVRRDLNASGIYDGSTTTKAYLLWVYVPAWHIYEKAAMTTDVEDRPAQGQRMIYARRRLAFQHMYGAVGTDDTTCMVYDFVDTAFN